MIPTSIFRKHIHKVKFYPRVDDFTQALLVMLVTNIMSAITIMIMNMMSIMIIMSITNIITILTITMMIRNTLVKLLPSGNSPSPS